MNMELAKKNFEKYINEVIGKQFNIKELANEVDDRCGSSSIVLTGILAKLKSNGVDNETIEFVEQGVMLMIDIVKEATLLHLVDDMLKDGDNIE